MLELSWHTGPTSSYPVGHCGLALGCALAAADIRLMRLTPTRANLRILFSLLSHNLWVPTIGEAQAWLGNALHPTSRWQCGIACASFAGPGSETRLTAMSTATSTAEIVLAAIAALLVPGCGHSSASPSRPADTTGNASKPRGSRTREEFCLGLPIGSSLSLAGPPVTLNVDALL